MRIGRTIIDTDNMSIEELKTLERTIHDIRRRKERGEELVRRFNELIADAKAEEFSFIDKEFGCVIMGNDFKIYDEHM